MSLTKKQINQQGLILDKIYTKGPISRIDISKELKITPATVSDLTHLLIDHKVIHELGEEDGIQNKAGRKKILLSISKNHSFYLGVELFEHYVSFCLSDNVGEIIQKDVVELFERSFTEDFFINELHKFMYSCSKYDIKSIGIAIPGHYNKDSDFIMTNNPFWENLRLSTIKEAFNIPIYFENNVNCMAISERLFGKDKQDLNFLFLHFRRGMYCAYMYDKEIYARDNYLVGEIGHTVINPDGELCECGKQGCLQTYASQTWIIKKAQILYDNVEHSYLRKLIDSKEQITIDVILTAYLLGDEGIITILHNAMRYLSIAINNLLVSMDADIIYIHGELFQNEDLKQLLKNLLDDNALLFKTQEKLIRKFIPYSQLNGAIGACAFAMTKSFNM